VSAQRRAARDACCEGARDESVGITAHPQRRHQVFEHGARPGKQDKAPECTRMLASQLEPALLMNLVASDCKKCGNAGFRSNHVVASLMEFLRAHVVSDGENLTAWIGEKGKFHFLHETLGLLRNGAKASGKGSQVLAAAVRQGRAEPFAKRKQAARSRRVKAMPEAGLPPDALRMRLPRRS
jgi:hypothetical protein